MAINMLWRKKTYQPVGLIYQKKWDRYWRQNVAVYEWLHWWFDRSHYRKSMLHCGYPRCCITRPPRGRFSIKIANYYIKILSLYRNIRNRFQARSFKLRLCTKQFPGNLFWKWVQQEKVSLQLRLVSVNSSVNRFRWDKFEELPNWFLTFSFFSVGLL